MTETNTTETVLFFRNTKKATPILLALFLLMGIAIRLIDFTDLPLDFAVTRQFHSLIMARGLYYQMDTPATQSMPQDIREFGISTGKSEPVIEPPILENLVAFTYRLIGKEDIFVGRIYSILFWVLGGIPLFLLARKMMSVNGAFTALAFYLFIPFGVFASRSFQPDPMMVMWVLWALYFQVVWVQSDNLKNAILAGIFTGIAILVKAPMVFFVGIPFAGLVLQRGFKQWIKNKRVYLMMILSILPALIYNLLSATVGGNANSIFGARFFPQLFIDPRWYLNWLQMIQSVIGLFPLVIGLLGIFLIYKKEHRVFLACLWLAYILYGYTFAYHIYTHDYYQLPLLPVLALGTGFVFSAVFQKLEELNRRWLARALVMLILIFSLALCVQHARGVLVASDYRNEAAYWKDLGKKIGNNTSVIALTQDYGYRISYWGFISPALWPTAADRTVKVLEGATDPAFRQMFKELTLHKDVFLVTMPGEFDKQPDLKEYLFATYPYQQGDSYYIFDLDHPLPVKN
jgi:hypothetical protein